MPISSRRQLRNVMDIENVMLEDETTSLADGNALGSQISSPATTTQSEMMVNDDDDDNNVNPNLEDNKIRKLDYWKNHYYAVGLVNVTWDEEKTESDFCSDRCCLFCTGVMCSNRFIQAGRIGNMVVLSKDGKWMMGPFWPMLLLITYPLIFGVSGWCYITVVSKFAFYEQFSWICMTLTLIISLGLTSFRNPGIWERKHEREQASWIWNDQGRTWRPRGARYDHECGKLPYFLSV